MSRKITKESIAAFLSGKRFNKANTSVLVNEDAGPDQMAALYLYGNCIARRYLATGKLEITTAGWSTRTTRERLNGLPGVAVFQHNHTQYLAPFNAGVPVFGAAFEWNGDWIAVDKI